MLKGRDCKLNEEDNKNEDGDKKDEEVNKNEDEDKTSAITTSEEIEKNKDAGEAPAKNTSEETDKLVNKDKPSGSINSAAIEAAIAAATVKKEPEDFEREVKGIMTVLFVLALVNYLIL